MIFSTVSDNIVSGCGRDEFLLMGDDEFLKHCRVSVFIGSGPGGQHRNRNYTAVRIIFNPIPELSAEDCTSRSQKQNIASALQKLRLKIALAWRKKAPDCAEFVHLNENNPLYPLKLAELLDMICCCNLDHKQAACRMGISNSKLLKELAREPEVWQNFQLARAENGLSALNMPGK